MNIYKEFKKKFGGDLDHKNRDLGNDELELTWYYPNLTEYELKNFFEKIALDIQMQYRVICVKQYNQGLKDGKLNNIK